MRKQTLIESDFAIIELSDNHEYRFLNYVTGEIRQYENDNVHNLYNHFNHTNRLYKKLVTIHAHNLANTVIHYNVASELTEKQYNKALYLTNLYLSHFDNSIDAERFNTICYLVITNKI